MKKSIMIYPLICCVIFIVSFFFINPVSEKRALEIAQTAITHDEQLQIINYNQPEIESLVFPEDESHFVKGLDGEKKNLMGVHVWKICYRTEQDGLLDSIVLYLDYYSGKIYGFDY